MTGPKPTPEIAELLRWVPRPPNGGDPPYWERFLETLEEEQFRAVAKISIQLEQRMLELDKARIDARMSALNEIAGVVGL